MESIVEFSTKDVIQLTLDTNTIMTFAMSPDHWNKDRLLPNFTLNGESIICIGTDEELTTEFCEAICVLLAYVKSTVVLGD
ncbi:hypothetical protein QIJ19_gp1 [ssRNA phage SRR5466725_8]|uniref:Uncharacterized protein n=1 Tax=ssRNA phage SRR5466725_8 TaxID=2786427 RepID=A0A8S5L4Y6_9VIRU|nr:hypothetical protein QIJ19_gp1 [ssRNA phage SRR5466725_8]DAD52397.1 TPA_asm: hypothetical protein [ssRNA phage SRR5466725_8]